METLPLVAGGPFPCIEDRLAPQRPYCLCSLDALVYERNVIVLYFLTMDLAVADAQR